MKKLLELAISIWVMMTILSCTYDYQFPDYTALDNTEVKYRYTVADISSEVKQQLLPIAMECGVTLQYASEQWRIVVTEKDAAGNILYQGEPRDRTDNNTKFLEISYICSCRLQDADWTYYDICRFDFEKKYSIGDTPLPIFLSVSPGDKYTVTKYPIYVYNIDRGGLNVIEKIHSLGYTLLDVKTIITEKDENGDTIRSFEHRMVDGMIITTVAKTIDVEIPLYGQPQNSAEKVYVGSYFFRGISLEEINGTTLTLTEDMEYEFVENGNDGMAYSYNINEHSIPFNKIANSYGYEISAINTIITEKDNNGNIIRSFEHGVNTIYASKEVETIDIEIKVYGSYSINYEWGYIGSYFFRNIKIKEINGTTLTLTEDMEHEFVENEKMPYSYNINRDDLPVVEKINSYGYSVADVNMIITEKDGNGNDIRVFEHRTIDGMISTEAKTIDVEIALYGYTSNYDKVYVGSYIFKDINLAKINGTTLTLTEDMEHEFVENPDL